MPATREQWTAYLLFNLGYRKFGKLTAVAGRLIGMRALARLGKTLAYGTNKSLRGVSCRGAESQMAETAERRSWRGAEEC